MMKRVNLYIVCCLLISFNVFSCSVQPQEQVGWPLWQSFEQTFITASGRVVDPYDDLDITTSEGQSYAMFFAIVNDQPELFSRLLNWTELNLAQGDLSKTLPAWKWGENAHGKWQVLDANSASDSDLWIIYNLLEAARLWNKPDYFSLAHQMAALVLEKEVIELPGLGITLLPAELGFYQEHREARLNPSYLPIQLLTRLADAFEDPRWKKLVPASYRLILASSPQGFSPDWVRFDLNTGLDVSNTTGSYNAIRVYLWAGMLAEDARYFKELVDHFKPMVDYIDSHQHAPISININDSLTQGRAGVGFHAALLPLVSKHSTSATQVILKDISSNPVSKTNNYYDYALTLFGLGWYENRFRFSQDGRLQRNVGDLWAH